MGKWGWVQPEYRKFEPFHTPFTALFLKVSHKPMELLLHAGSSRKVEQRWVTIPSPGGEMQMLISEPKDTDETLPLMIYTHGGGFGFGAAPQHRWMNALFAREANCRVLMPDYRLLPEYPYPAAREDDIAAYAWACEHAEELHIDPERIAVGGESAGGALAIYLCRDAETRGLPAPKFQMLIYPVADERMETESMKKYTDTPMWNAEHNAEMWRMYTGRKDLPGGIAYGNGAAQTTAPDLYGGGRAGLPARRRRGLRPATGRSGRNGGAARDQGRVPRL